MTIQQLFDELRLEVNWQKEVVILTPAGTKNIVSVVPNIINDTQFMLECNEE